MTREKAMRVLELHGHFDQDVLKAAFRRMCLRVHPDHGGSDAAMREVLAAREELEKAPINQRQTTTFWAHHRWDPEEMERDLRNAFGAVRAHRAEQSYQRSAYQYDEVGRPRQARTVLPDTPEQIRKRRREHADALFALGLITVEELRRTKRK